MDNNIRFKIIVFQDRYKVFDSSLIKSDIAAKVCENMLTLTEYKKEDNKFNILYNIPLTSVLFIERDENKYDIYLK